MKINTLRRPIYVFFYSINRLTMQNQQSSSNPEPYPLTHPIYTRGSCCSAQDAIQKINERQQEYGTGKYINFIGRMPLSDLPIVQAAFPNHTIRNTAATGWSPYYEVRPR